MRSLMIHHASSIMIDQGLVSMAAKAVGIDFNELVRRILETSMEG